MNTSNWARVKTIFEHALTLPADEVHAYIKEACAGDTACEKEVTDLVSFADDSPFILDQPIEIPATLLLTEDKDPPVLGQRLGPYVLVDKLGQGGMGNVFLAHRIDGQFLKQVAIKLIRTDRLRSDLRIRFDRERQILSNLSHPGIAGLIDGGVTDDGIPFLVMEYIEGLPLLAFVRKNNPPITVLLTLFKQICEAVHSAHQSLVIHRDLKPSNILVTNFSNEDNTQQRVKLLDFGIAKLIEPEKTHDITQTGARAMTPEYASPEQIRGDQITTASDIYSLGVVLHELLTGIRPFNLHNKSPAEIENIICTKTPAKPSSIVNVAEDHNARPHSLTAKVLKGDLDNIVLKALHKDPLRRYESAIQFGADISAYLQTRPVIARPDTMGYRFSKFISRNSRGVAVAGLMMLLVAGGVWTTNRQAHIANQRFEQVRSLANSLLSDLHNAIRDLPGATQAREMLVSKALTYLDELSKEQTNDLSLRYELAAAYEKVGRIQGDPHYTNLGDLRGAYDSYEKALMLRKLLWEEHPDNTAYQHALAVSYGRMGVVKSWSGDSDGALKSSSTGFELIEPLLHTASSDSLLYDAGRIQSEIGWFQIWAGQIDDGLLSLDEAIHKLESISKDSPLHLDVTLDLWRAYYYSVDGYRFSQQHDSALQLLEQKALGMLEKLIRTYPTNSRVQYSYHTCLWFIGAQQHALGNVEEALSAYNTSLQAAQAMVAADSANHKSHEAEAFAHAALAQVHNSLGHTEDAIAHIDQAIDIRTRLFNLNPDNHSIAGAVASGHRYKCRTLIASEQTKQALESCEEMAALYQTLFSEQTSNIVLKSTIAYAYAYMGRIYRQSGQMASTFELRNSRFEDALSWLKRSHKILLEIQAIEEDLAWEVHPDSVAVEIAEMEQILNY